MAKFKCISSNCAYDFTSDLDIRSMRQSLDYVEVPVVPATIVQVKPVPVAPVKPLPVAPAVPKAV